MGKQASKTKLKPKAVVKTPAKAANKADSKPNAKPNAKPSASPAVAKKTGAPAPDANKAAAAKKNKKAKVSKKIEEDDDLLVGEADGPEEAIEGLEEMEEIEALDASTQEDVAVDESVDELLEDSGAEASSDEDDEIVLTDAEGRRLCRVRDCDQAAIVETYCRFHYLQNWKRIQVRRGILADGKLERYVEELTSRYPDKFLEMIRKDLRSEKDFLSSIAELEIDESAVDSEFEDESQSFIDEVRGVTETAIPDDEEF